MSIYATLDVGSFQVLLFIAQVKQGEIIRTLYDGGIITRLGDKINSLGVVHEQSVKRTIAALNQFSRTMREHNVIDQCAIGTSAFREAHNTAGVLKDIYIHTGISIEVISGQEEARLSFTGATSGIKAKSDKLMLLDIGGRSTELVWGQQLGIKKQMSMPLGALKMTESYITSDPPSLKQVAALENFIKKELAPLKAPFTEFEMIGTGGTITNLASIYKKIESFSGDKIQGLSLSLDTVLDLKKQFQEMTTTERARLPGIQPQRAGVILAGTIILLELMKRFTVLHLTVSNRGLRHGLFLQRFLQA